MRNMICQLCRTQLKLPPNRNVRVYTWCGIDWNCNLSEGIPWDAYENEHYQSLPWTTPWLIEDLKPRSIKLIDGGAVVIDQHVTGEYTHKWEYNPPAFFCRETLTLYIHGGIAELYD